MFLGIDLGTSGVRVCIQNIQGEKVGFSAVPYPPGTIQVDGVHHEQDAHAWWTTVLHCIDQLPTELRIQCEHIAIDGTSGTIVATNVQGEPQYAALMYNDARASEEAALIKTFAPQNSGATGATSGLAKILWLQKNLPETKCFLHQADWLAGNLTGDYSFSDQNNCLKSGFDVVERCWPDWISQTGLHSTFLPKVYKPGCPVSTIQPSIAERLSLPKSTTIHAGTTDSIAAFLATPACETGDAVTSLGSTLAIKLISDQPVFAPEFGIYSHRLGNNWLIGGASNSGGAALLAHFSLAEIKRLSLQISDTETELDYYPLPSVGERFPIANPFKQSTVTPRPGSDVEFLKALLVGIARIEAGAYKKLESLGAPYPRQVFSAGGGATNSAWMNIRRRYLECPVIRTDSTEAACGAARLAAFNQNSRVDTRD